MFFRQKRRRLAFERRQVVHVIVEWLEAAVEGVAQDLIEPAVFRLAREERDAEVMGGGHLRWHAGQHGEAAGHVKTADTHRHSGDEKRAGEVDGAGKLVRLDADEADQGPTAGAA